MSDIVIGPAFTPNQILSGDPEMRAAYDREARDGLVAIATYVTGVLTRPDARVGRAGAVCPFVAGALQAGMITVAVLPVRLVDAASLRRAARSLRADFIRPAGTGSNRTESLRATIIALPYLDARDGAVLVERVQKALKPEMVEAGLMIGEFYPGCALPGLNNPGFRPADTPFCCLALRRMAAADRPFLLDDERFVRAYDARFGRGAARRGAPPSSGPSPEPLPAVRSDWIAALSAVQRLPAAPPPSEPR